MSERPSAGERIFRGIPVSPGVCRGKVLILGGPQQAVPRYRIAEGDVAAEIQRFEQALVQTRQDVLEVQRKVREAMGAEEAGIFDAHLLVLEDPVLIEEVTRLIQQERVNVEHAFQQTAEKYAALLSQVEDEYLRERSADLRDVTTRVLHRLMGQGERLDLSHLAEPVVIISHDLAPSTTATLDKTRVLGFATDIGGKTSHTAIVARSLQIPAVVGLTSISTDLANGDDVLLDGYNGVVILNPSDQTLFEYGQIERRHVDVQAGLRELQHLPAVTLDGTRVVLAANIERPDDTVAVLAGGAEGVGLFRTEFLFLKRQALPTEDEQYEAYRQVALAVKPHPVIIRTLDLGGDKFLTPLQVPKEMNPFLGWRAIRLCLQERDLFRAQLRAILRASTEGNVKVMFPMISGLDELNQAIEVFEEAKCELYHRGAPFSDHVELGAMIEVPSAVMVADALARRVQFFSLGTNDLIQYTLAVDRQNERIAHLYEPTHPAILNSIKLTVEAGARHGIWTGVCGEMGGDPVFTPLLLGLGVSELSMAPAQVPAVKFVVRHLKLSQAQELARFATSCDSSSEILAECRRFVREIAPALVEDPAAVGA